MLLTKEQARQIAIALACVHSLDARIFIAVDEVEPGTDTAILLDKEGIKVARCIDFEEQHQLTVKYSSIKDFCFEYEF